MNKEQVLDEIFSNDPLDLLNIKPKASNARTADERLLASFQEISDFIDTNNRLPEQNISNMSEFQLFSRLKSLKEDQNKVELLKEHDIHNIL